MCLTNTQQRNEHSGNVHSSCHYSDTIGLFTDPVADNVPMFTFLQSLTLADILSHGHLYKPVIKANHKSTLQLVSIAWDFTWECNHHSRFLTSLSSSLPLRCVNLMKVCPLLSNIYHSLPWFKNNSIKQMIFICCKRITSPHLILFIPLCIQYGQNKVITL